MANTAVSGESHEVVEGHSRPESLTEFLCRCEEVARCAGVLTVHLGVTVEQAEALLMGEARRRGLPVHLVARRVVVNPSAAGEWAAEVCSECDEALRVVVLGRYGLGRELLCPIRH